VVVVGTPAVAVDHPTALGARLLKGAHHVAVGGFVNERACAFNLPTAADRDELIRRLWPTRGEIVLPAGGRRRSFPPALTVARGELDIAVPAVRAALPAVAWARPRLVGLFPGYPYRSKEILATR
jgi:hypothetical protein